jgi:hypothetical protein
MKGWSAASLSCAAVDLPQSPPIRKRKVYKL